MIPTVSVYQTITDNNNMLKAVLFWNLNQSQRLFTFQLL